MGSLSHYQVPCSVKSFLSDRFSPLRPWHTPLPPYPPTPLSPYPATPLPTLLRDSNHLSDPESSKVQTSGFPDPNRRTAAPLDRPLGGTDPLGRLTARAAECPGCGPGLGVLVRVCVCVCLGPVVPTFTLLFGGRVPLLQKKEVQ